MQNLLCIPHNIQSLQKMNIQLSYEFPKDAKTLIVILLSNNNLAAANEWIDTDISGIQFEAKQAEKGAKNLCPSGTYLICTMGVGENPTVETLRRTTQKAVAFANEYKYADMLLVFPDEINEDYAIGMAESACLSNYQFLNYKSEKTLATLANVHIYGKGKKLESAIAYAVAVAEATAITRNLVNEPVITLSAEELANRAAAFGETYGFTSDIFNKSKIQALKMGGLLSVNMGSQLPPTFSILEYKPENPVNEKPIILVGKGVVFDTGGLSLKPTPNSMDMMKCDMAGAGAVIGAMCGVAKLKLNCHVIALIPATDNRPGENAYVPGDVITMYDGSTVEVLNTDAEGRMILADALAYAKQYEPELVIDLATLTGASVVAIGGVGVAMMGTADEETKSKLKRSGERVYERLVEFPLWEEYGEMMKSDIADMKNIGGSGAGAITAGKFLEKFTDYPWIHLDIAGAAWNATPDSYRGKNGTGVGVRLLIDYLKRR